MWKSKKPVATNRGRREHKDSLRKSHPLESFSSGIWRSSTHRNYRNCEVSKLISQNLSPNLFYSVIWISSVLFTRLDRKSAPKIIVRIAKTIPITIGSKPPSACPRIEIKQPAAMMAEIKAPSAYNIFFESLLGFRKLRFEGLGDSSTLQIKNSRSNSTAKLLDQLFLISHHLTLF